MKLLLLNLTPIIYFSTLRNFYVEMATSEGGEGGVEGLYIRSWEPTHIFNHIFSLIEIISTMSHKSKIDTFLFRLKLYPTATPPRTNYLRILMPFLM